VEVAVTTSVEIEGIASVVIQKTRWVNVGRTTGSFSQLSPASPNRPFSERLPRGGMEATRSVHRMHPAIAVRPRLADHVQGTPGVPMMFTHRVVCVTPNAMPSMRGDGGSP